MAYIKHFVTVKTKFQKISIHILAGFVVNSHSAHLGCWGKGQGDRGLSESVKKGKFVTKMLDEVLKTWKNDMC